MGWMCSYRGHFCSYKVASFNPPVTNLLQRGVSCREIKPHVRLDVVLRHALAVLVHVAKIVLGLVKAPIGSLAIPLHCLGIVLWHALALVVHDAKIVLGSRIALVGSLAIPLHCLGIVLRHACRTEVVSNIKSVRYPQPWPVALFALRTARDRPKGPS
jgi:hypothetical protein